MKVKKVMWSMFVLLFVALMFGGCSKTSSPDGAVRAFLDEIDKGNTESAKVYFSGQYSGGYDEHDKKKLERNFPPGSIKNVTFTNIKAVGESATLTVTIERTNGSPYTANLSMVKKGSDWKINYDGWSWPFPVE